MFEPTMIIAAASLVGLAIVAWALLRAWHGWLALKRQELERFQTPGNPDEGSSLGAARIEISDLKERIKKLEAIASGVDL
ncbi:hypothetical protein [Qipengyuania qiaonensis]|uniref:Uncharacterized protein n=1 Tax=Qipengyuania qiaonensis TaxID=2867240 RepID=A0ABS7J8W3_9SPHN|nr:hypothetical protein [Qipengyuania qiaonensis]MBX7483760.1 hypothetical protein [Qipengyuania qiaonensis]